MKARFDYGHYLDSVQDGEEVKQNLAAFVPGSAIGSAILDGAGADPLISTVIARLNERR